MVVTGVVDGDVGGDLTCSGVFSRLDTTRTIGLLRFAATRALKENSVGDAMSV